MLRISLRRRCLVTDLFDPVGLVENVQSDEQAHPTRFVDFGLGLTFLVFQDVSYHDPNALAGEQLDICGSHTSCTAANQGDLAL